MRDRAKKGAFDGGIQMYWQGSREGTKAQGAKWAAYRRDGGEIKVHRGGTGCRIQV